MLWERTTGAARRPRVRFGRDLPTAPSTRRVVIAAAALVGVWGGSTLLRVAHLPPGPIDRAWDAVVMRASGRVSRGVAEGMAVVGSGPSGTALVVAAGALIGATRGWFWGASVGVTSIVSVLDRAGLKALAQRARPDDAYGVLDAFPSGHTTFAALLGTVVILFERRTAVRGAAIGFIAAMAWSRTQLRAHWLTDVLGAVVLGSAEAVLLLAAAHRLRESSSRWRDAAPAAREAARRLPARGPRGG
ncbi:phosphatase PAP2 family protein [Amnibacterium kyonggiense]|uniref:phosphatase PAP2 family protein n=1 Tax=Amnibacterium kyonggiense TaxID=595671 RepID=UPI001060BA0C|nr:phosphatase PAP2 family protein [Amnibacterium kyonggiense]